MLHMIPPRIKFETFRITQNGDYPLRKLRVITIRLLYVETHKMFCLYNNEIAFIFQVL